jgi:hypothetical protein
MKADEVHTPVIVNNNSSSIQIKLNYQNKTYTYEADVSDGQTLSFRCKQ